MSVIWRVDKTQLEPEFEQDVDLLLSARPEKWVVHFGKRTTEEQQKLYNIWIQWLKDNPDKPPSQGPRAAPPGLSAHESGLAVDVTLVLINRKGQEYDQWDYNHPSWKSLVEAVHAHPRLHSLVSIGDTDHIEKVNWKAHKDWNKAAA